jgi:hypothetical protein
MGSYLPPLGTAWRGAIWGLELLTQIAPRTF